MSHRPQPDVTQIPIDYSTYRMGMESHMANAMNPEGVSANVPHGPVLLCPRCGVHRKGVFADDYCEEQDPVNPEGIVLIPLNLVHGKGDYKYFLSWSNFMRLEGRKFDMGQQLKLRCEYCIHQTIKRILEVRPERYRDLAQEG